MKKDLAMNVLKNGQWGSYRHIPLVLPETKIEQAYIDIQQVGQLSSLEWVESPPMNKKLGTLCYVYYSALNERDLMLAKGTVSPEFSDGKTIQISTDQYDKLGMEMTGRDEKGNRVMGIIPSKVCNISLPEKKNSI